MTGNDPDRRSGDREGGDEPMVSRRSLLAGSILGGVSAAGYYGFRGWTRFGGRDRSPATGEKKSASPEATDEGPTPWEKRADKRIKKHRTTPLDVVVADRRGNPVPSASVDVTMQRHKFGFGTAVDAAYLVRQTEEGDPYREALTTLFNKAVLENRHKWGFWEQPAERRTAEAATEWLLSQGLEMRGHTCIWQKRNEGAIPGDVVRAMNSGNGERIAERAHAHVDDIVSHYRDVSGFTEWDVVNEPVEEHGMTDVIEPNTPSTQVATVLDWLRTARRADPDAKLFINEYSILAGDQTAHKDDFEAIVKHVLDRDAPIDGIGIQGHHWSPDQRRTPAQLLATLDRFAGLVPSVQIQEYDTWGGAWTEQMEADYLHTFMKTVFSHPVVEGFLVWGFWDKRHWKGNGAFFREDWSKKPTHDVYTDLVFDQWWTDESGSTGIDGVYSTVGFLGEYELTARTTSAQTTKTVTLDDPTERTTVTLYVNE